MNYLESTIMKIMNFKFFALLLASLFILAGCQTTPQTPPPEELAVTTIINSLAQGDANTYQNYLDLSQMPAETQAEIRTQLPAIVAQAKELYYDPQGGVSNIVFNNKTFASDNSSVAIDFTIHFGNGNTENASITLVRMGDSWKIAN